jgi:CMP-N-acetylneuraminic acid synthetase
VARGGSTRLPNKALLPFGSSTLIGHKVRTLKQCLRIGRVVVGSDSDAILDEAAAHGAETVKRSDYHCDERVCSANEMIRNMVEKVDGGDDDVFVWAHPTNPLVCPETYDAAVDEYRFYMSRNFVISNPRDHLDSLASVTRIQRHAWYAHKPLNFTPGSNPHQQASALMPVWFQDGAIFIQTRKRWLETSYFYGNPVLFDIDAAEGTDIDTEADYLTAKALWESKCVRPSCPPDRPSPSTPGATPSTS